VPAEHAARGRNLPVEITNSETQEGVMAITFEGVLADRSRWQAQDCSIELALDAIGTPSSLLILREAFYGTTRFDPCGRRLPPRLKRLAANSICAREAT